MKVLIVSPQDPSGDLEILLREPFYEDKVQYMKGSVLEEKDLIKTKFRRAKSGFVLTAQSVADPIVADSQSILATKALKDANPDITVYCQLLDLESKKHAKWAGWDNLVCIDEIKMGILAKSCLCPGDIPQDFFVICNFKKKGKFSRI